ncbi:protein LiaH [Paraliobacillus ryukyuensis]|uniref:Phage shock protein A (PspA) family protein n=1 Tax=Paraliobacillus ryukyuensis TaxID=200904 RepID=A0A366EGA8_9BACI|nr:PspA/IM30 family protein [Paraliobacillus ryukyuensis]RBP00469.1 phage shock protein A (PspA) family protein [Paraliobacillus ryukyuensis]
MANLFTRLKATVVADFHELLDQKEQKHPMTHLNQYIRNCEEEVKRLKQLIEKQYTIQQEYQKELQLANAMVEKRKRQATLAEEMNEEELVQEAIEELQHYQTRVNQLSEMADENKNQLSQIETKYVQMKQKLKDLYVKRLELRGRENIARVHKGMNNVLHTELLDKSESKFQDVENYIERLEQQVTTKYRLHTLDARFAELEKKVSTSK